MIKRPTPLIALLALIASATCVHAQNIFWTSNIPGVHYFSSQNLNSGSVDLDAPGMIGKISTVLSKKETGIPGFAIDGKNKQIYYIDVKESSIRRVDFQDANDVLIATFPKDTLHSLAVDPTHNRLFFGITPKDESTGGIMSCNLNGGEVRVLIPNVKDPTGIILDPDGERLFYLSDSNTISKVGYEGIRPEVLVSLNGKTVKGGAIAIDQVKKILYIGTQECKCIKQYTFDGTDQGTAIDDLSASVDSIAVDSTHGVIYFSLSGLEGIPGIYAYQADHDHSGNKPIKISSNEGVTLIDVVE
jgi:sugar lactone lactonase YvrE